MLAYMQQQKAILAATDRATDVRQLIEREARCGLWCASDDEKAFVEHVRFLCMNRDLIPKFGASGYQYLRDHFSVERSVDILERHFHSRL